MVNVANVLWLGRNIANNVAGENPNDNHFAIYSVLEGCQ